MLLFGSKTIEARKAVKRRGRVDNEKKRNRRNKRDDVDFFFLRDPNGRIIRVVSNAQRIRLSSSTAPVVRSNENGIPRKLPAACTYAMRVCRGGGGGGGCRRPSADVTAAAAAAALARRRRRRRRRIQVTGH